MKKDKLPLKRANFEFFKRDSRQFKKFIEEKKLSLTDLREKHPALTKKERDEIIEDALYEPAAKTYYENMDIKAEYRASKRLFKRHNMTKEEIDIWLGYGKPDHFCDEFDELYSEELQKDAKEIIKTLLYNRPSKKVLVAIDTNRSVEDIISDVKRIVVSEKRGRFIGEKRIQTRKKWLPKLDQLLEVWDLYSLAGQHPAAMTFKEISRKVRRPLSTVKSQWYLAYEKIMGEKYDPASKFATEQKRASADELCATCKYVTEGKDPACYRGGDWFPCHEYLKIAGRERKIIHAKYDDNLDSNARSTRKKKPADRQ